MHTTGDRTFVDRGSGKEYQVSETLVEQESEGEIQTVRALVFTTAAGEWKWAAIHASIELADLSHEELEELVAQAR